VLQPALPSEAAAAGAAPVATEPLEPHALWVPAPLALARLRAKAARSSLPARVPTTATVPVTLRPAISRRDLKAGWRRCLMALTSAVGRGEGSGPATAAASSA